MQKYARYSHLEYKVKCAFPHYLFFIFIVIFRGNDQAVISRSFCFSTGILGSVILDDSGDIDVNLTLMYTSVDNYEVSIVIRKLFHEETCWGWGTAAFNKRVAENVYAEMLQENKSLKLIHKQ